jgi:hypothetical protein
MYQIAPPCGAGTGTGCALPSRSTILGSHTFLGTGSEGVRGALTSSPFVRNRRATEHAHIHV